MPLCPKLACCALATRFLQIPVRDWTFARELISGSPFRGRYLAGYGIVVVIYGILRWLYYIQATWRCCLDVDMDITWRLSPECHSHIAIVAMGCQRIKCVEEFNLSTGSVQRLGRCRKSTKQCSTVWLAKQQLLRLLHHVYHAHPMNYGIATFKDAVAKTTANLWFMGWRAARATREPRLA